MVRFKCSFFILLIMVCLFITLPDESIIDAQVQFTATPVQVILPTQTALPTSISIATLTPTITSTPKGVVLLRASSSVDENTVIIVREKPDPAAKTAGNLDRKDENGNVPDYVVTGRYGGWWEIVLDEENDRRVWVFGSVVELIGDSGDVPTVDPFVTPPPTIDVNPVALDAADFESTLAVITRTPDAILTVTAQNRIINVDDNPRTLERLPTFTPPPDAKLEGKSTIQNIITNPDDDLSQQVLSTLFSGRLPPIVPILLLAGSGFVGLVLSTLFQRSS